jgi:hypothetical protein
MPLIGFNIEFISALGSELAETSSELLSSSETVLKLIVLDEPGCATCSCRGPIMDIIIGIIITRVAVIFEELCTKISVYLFTIV